MILKLGSIWGLKLYKLYVNDDPGLALTYFDSNVKIWSRMHLNGGGTVTESLNGNLQEIAKLREDLCIRKNLTQRVNLLPSSAFLMNIFFALKGSKLFILIY